MDINESIELALKHYQTGNLQAVEDICKKILKVQPENTKALHFLGILSYRYGNYDLAIEHIEKALYYGASDPEAYFDLGNALHEKGQLDKAITSYQKALQLDPAFTDAYNNLGVAFHDKGQPDEAVTCYQKALQLNPNLAYTYNNLGIILQEKGNFDEAVNYYQKALLLDPNYADAHYNLGVVFKEQRRLDEAITCFQKALQLNPDFTGAYNNLGLAFHDKGQLDEAILCYQKALQLNPTNIYAFCNLGNTLAEKGQLDEAVGYYEKAIELNPNDAHIYNNLGFIFYNEKQLDKAIPYFQKAIELDPNFAMVYCNLGNALKEKGQFDEAITYYQRALQLDPELVDAHLNMSLLLLLRGNFEEGWKEYGWRWKLKDFYRRNYSQPLWDGADISGRTILLHAEQGFGDTIQFVRYVPFVAQGRAKVIVECQTELVTLLKSVEGVSQVVSRGEQLHNFVIHCPLLTLPLIFNTTLNSIPAKIPYITVDSMLVQKWQEKIQHDNLKLKIGLVWAGGSTFRGDRNRSCSLEIFSPLAQIKGITLYSLQKGEAAKQARKSPTSIKLIDHTTEIIDFSDTAALIENLDLIITVDTAVAHLAGALGKPVWTLLPFVPDWRWLLNREDSPWYPTMRLFRQPSPGNWEAVMENILDELKKKVIKNPPHNKN